MKKKSYALGDVVRYKGKEVIVTSADFNQGTLEYSLTHFGAWYPHSKLSFVRDADDESLKALSQLEEDLENEDKEERNE